MDAVVDEFVVESSSCFDEMLIKEVEKCPTLYNSSLREHRDRQKRNLVWIDIGRTLQKSPGDCEHRWRYLRDKYVKEKKKLTDPVFANETKKPWLYMSCAQFLDPFLKPKTRSPRKHIPRASTSRPTRLRRTAQQTPLQTLAVLCSLPSSPTLDNCGTQSQLFPEGSNMDLNGMTSDLNTVITELHPQRKKTILGDNSKTLQALNRAAKRTASREEHFLLSLVNKFAALPDDFKDEFEMSTLSLLAKLKKKAAAQSKDKRNLHFMGISPWTASLEQGYAAECWQSCSPYFHSQQRTLDNPVTSSRSFAEGRSMVMSEMTGDDVISLVNKFTALSDDFKDEFGMKPISLLAKYR